MIHNYYWNPWKGCHKISEGCHNCFMFYQSSQKGIDPEQIIKSDDDFDLPIQINDNGEYKIPSGSILRVCMNSDFFLSEADNWRKAIWNIIHQRKDIIFFLLTKRPERVQQCLPEQWENGWENVALAVTCENQRLCDIRLPILSQLPFRHKIIMCAPLIGEIQLEKYLAADEIEQVICDGENYGGKRPCEYEWVERLYCDCKKYNISFNFVGCGNVFIKDGHRFHITTKDDLSLLAQKQGLRFYGNPIIFKLPHQEITLKMYE